MSRNSATSTFSLRNEADEDAAGGNNHLKTLLHRAFPLHQQTLLQCRKCLDDKNSFVLHYKATLFLPYEDMFYLQCTNCKFYWFVCKLCPGQRTHYENRSEAARHIRDKGHLKPAKDTSTSQFPDSASLDDFNLTSTSPENTNTVDCVDAIQDTSDVTKQDSTSQLFPFCSDMQINYFMHNFNILTKDRFEGVRYLVSNALHHQIAVECMEELTEHHILFHSNIAYVLSRISPAEKICLVNSFQHLTKLHKAGIPIDEYLVPSSVNLMNQRYLKGKYSFMHNIPKPVVSNIGRHGYVSLKSCIADLLARHNFEIEEIVQADFDSVQYIGQCRRARLFVEYVKDLDGLVDPHIPRLILYIIEWSDDFDPAKCIKDNRGSAWVKSVTISPLHINCEEFKNTYPIAIGYTKDSHEDVEAAYNKELQELRSGNLQFRLGKYGQLVYVYADTLVSLQDQIERRSMNNIMLGSSAYSARWGHICNLKHIMEKVPSCDDCWERLRSEQDSASCEICFNWDTDMRQYPVPSKYPIEMRNTTPFLTSKKLTYESLKFATNKAIASMSRPRQGPNRPWTKEAVTCYLTTEGINGEMIRKIAAHAKQLSRAISSQATEVPVWNNPTLWERGVPLDSYIDVPMHLLFLGIVKSTLSFVNIWISSRGWNLLVTSRTNNSLDAIGGLNLSWCRCIPQWQGKESRTLTTTGWVSENYLAMARVISWYYAELFTKKLSERSQDFLEVTMLLSSLRAMISRIMTRTVDAKLIQDVQRHIKIFLQCFHIFTSDSTCFVGIEKENTAINCDDNDDKKSDEDENDVNAVALVQGRKRKRSKANKKTSSNTNHDTCTSNPTNIKRKKSGKQKNNVYPWIEKYNFCCLLNIPNIMLHFGPVRNYWEGGMFGEKLLQYAKGTWHGFTSNWAENMIKNIINSFSVKRTIFDLLKNGDDNVDGQESNSTNNVETNNNRSGYHVYRSLEHVQSAIENGIPISVIIFSDEVVVSINGNHHITVHFHTNDYTWSFGQIYFSFSLCDIKEDKFSKERILAFGLMLPLYDTDNIDKWTVVTSEWTDISFDGTYRFPKVVTCDYNN